MGTGKKEKTRKERQGKVGDGMSNVKTKGENFYRSAKQAKTLNMFKGGEAQRNASGKVTKAAVFQSRDKPKARVEPNRKWFGNTRVISQVAVGLPQALSTTFRVFLSYYSRDMSCYNSYPRAEMLTPTYYSLALFERLWQKRLRIHTRSC